MKKVSGWWVVAAFVVFAGVMLAAGSNDSRSTRRAEKRLADLERRVKASEQAQAQPGPANPFPIYEVVPMDSVRAEVDLWDKRLSYRTSNEPRRTR